MKHNTLILLLKLCMLVCLSGCQYPDNNKNHQHPRGEAVNHDFSDAEKWSKKFDNPKRDNWQKPKTIIQIMEIETGDRVADIGAGTGYLLSHLSKAVGSKGKVYALDVDANLIDFMKNRIEKESLQNTTAKLIPENSPGEALKDVSKVVFLNTWHHVPSRKEYSKKMYETLPSNASVYVVDPEKGVGGPGPRDSHRMKASQVIKELSSANFKCDQMEETLKYQYVVRCEK